MSVFDGPIPFDEFLAKIDSKLHLVPRYRQLAVVPPFQVGYPTWEWDQHFDIHKHVFRVHLDPPGGERELSELAGRILSEVMEGLKDGRGALIPRVHHSLADGISGAALPNVILDQTPEASRVSGKRQYRVPRPQPKPENSVPDARVNALRSTLENLLAAEAGVVSLAESLLSGPMREGLQGLVRSAAGTGGFRGTAPV